MRNLKALKACFPALLAAALSLPAPALAFWSGPGCFLADMLGGGGFSGGFRFSTGARGLGYGHPYGALPLYGAPYRVEPGAAWMSPAPPPGPGESTPRRAAEVLRANIWHPEIVEPAEARAAGSSQVPRNRWQP